MFDILLQVDSLTTAAKTTGEVESVWSLLSKGGPLMIPLGILFALAVFFFIERLLVVRKVSKIDENDYLAESNDRNHGSFTLKKRFGQWIAESQTTHSLAIQIGKEIDKFNSLDSGKK